MTDMPPPPPPPPPGGAPPPPPPGGEPAASMPMTGGAKAGFGPRLGAAILDALILGVPFTIVNLVALNAVPTELVSCEGGTRLCEQPTGGGWGILILLYLVELGIGLWYWGEFEGNRGQSLGKKALNIKTIDATTGANIGMGRAIGRYFARILSAIPCLLGYLWMLWDSEKQTWHDKIVNSSVVQA